MKSIFLLGHPCAQPPSLARKKNTVARKVENGVSKVRLYWGAFIPNDGHRISDEEIGVHQKYFSKIIGLHQYNILQSHWTSTIIFFKNHLLWDSRVKTLLLGIQKADRGRYC